MGKLIDNAPFWLIAVLAVVMGLAPFQPQPHLVEKLGMLADGTLVRPLDIFDLFWHSLFPVLFVVKAVRHFRSRTEGE